MAIVVSNHSCTSLFHVVCGTALQVNEIFDLISYNKGASVIRMLIGWLGEDVFFAGIHRYLDAYKHKNATTNDLWDVLAAVSGQPVRDVMRQWTAHGGYPFLLASGSLAAGEGLSLRSGRFMAPWARKDDAWPGADDFARGPGIAAFDAAAAAHAPAAGGAGAGAAAAEAEDSNSWWNIPLSAVTGAGAGTAPATHKLGVLMLAPPEGAAAAAPSRDSALSTMAGAITDAARKAGASYVKLNAEVSRTRDNARPTTGRSQPRAGTLSARLPGRAACHYR